MSDMSEHLLDLAKRFESLRQELEPPEMKAAAARVNKGVDQLMAAHCGSWLGAQSLIYYKDFQTIPAGAHFSVEWGLMRSSGEWGSTSFDLVVEHLKRLAGKPTFDEMMSLAKSVGPKIEHVREELISVLTSLKQSSDDPYIARLLDKANETELRSSSDVIAALRPSGKFFTRDPSAMAGTLNTPPHIAVASEMMNVHLASDFARDLGSIAQQAATHLGLKLEARRSSHTGAKVAIGHGRSPLWRELKDFIQERLRLQVDEFNRVPVAGVTNIARLTTMLSEAEVAFIIMTAEDELKDGSVQARMNVIHEVGLFQGKLGFTRAIVLLEENCEQFSNIEGLF